MHLFVQNDECGPSGSQSQLSLYLKYEQKKKVIAILTGGIKRIY